MWVERAHLPQRGTDSRVDTVAREDQPRRDAGPVREHCAHAAALTRLPTRRTTRRTTRRVTRLAARRTNRRTTCRTAALASALADATADATDAGHVDARFRCALVRRDRSAEAHLRVYSTIH